MNREKPKSWAVLNDGSQRFKDTVIKYINENDMNYNYWKGVDLYYYGFTTEAKYRCAISEDRFSTTLTIDEFCEIFLGEKKEANIDAVVDLLKSVSDETGVGMDKLNAKLIDGQLHVWRLVMHKNSAIEMKILKTFNINK